MQRPKPQRPVARRLSLRRRLLFISVPLLLTLLAVEIVLQAYYYVSAGDFLFRRAVPPIYEADETRCFRLKPDLDYIHRTNEFAVRIYTNSQGFRTDAARRTIPIEKGENVFRILFLGPSFAMGWANDFEDSYAALIAGGLTVPGKRVELINLGTPAQGPEAQLCWLEKEGYRFDPDLVVETSYGRQLSSLPRGCPADLACPEIRNGHLYTTEPSLLRRIVHRAKNSAVVFYGYYAYHAVAGRRAGAGSEVGTGKELYSDEERSVGSTDPAELVEDYLGFMDFVRRTVGEHVHVAFIHVPLSFVVHPADASRWRHLLDVNPGLARARTRAGAEALLAHGVPMIDTTEALIGAGASERMYYWLDIHLTPAGNRVVAETALPGLEALVSRSAPAPPEPPGPAG